ncbi:MAG: GNAT family N-acetyltransferase [Candidatus Merdivicinus sp.]|jgi:GNAT superfamily N-acetyltransferase
MKIEDANLFFCCPVPVPEAFTDLPEGYQIRNCRKEELWDWMDLPFDTPEEANQYRGYMEDFFAKVYAPHGNLFFKQCRLLLEPDGRIAGSCFIWKAYEKVTTVHWFKIRKDLEGHGLGRALLSAVLREVQPEDYPICLHTQPGSFRAIKLYIDFGFYMAEDPVIGQRINQWKEALPYLREMMPKPVFDSIRIGKAPEVLLRAAAQSVINEF